MSLSLLQAKVRSTHPDTSQVSAWDITEAALQVVGDLFGTLGAGGHVIVDSGVITTVSTVTAVTAITNALPAGTNLLGKVGPSQSTAVPDSFVIRTADATVFTLAAGERGVIQNLHTTGLAVKLGASGTNSSLNVILPGGTATDDGKSSPFIIQSWIGAVSVAAMTGSPRFLAWKI